MSLKHRFKRWLYGKCPGCKGRLPYFGERLYFPPNSMVFGLACAQGIYERENLRIMQSALRPQAWYFDIGANIGLMSVPLLDSEPTLQVVSVEASPGTASYLARTVAASPRRDRWRFVAKAVGATEGETVFLPRSRPKARTTASKTPAGGALRARSKSPSQPSTRFGASLASPTFASSKSTSKAASPMSCAAVSRACAPPGPMSCSNAPLNLAPFGTPPAFFLTLAAELNCDMLAAPTLAPVTTPERLRLKMGLGEMFLLA